MPRKSIVVTTAAVAALLALVALLVLRQAPRGPSAEAIADRPPLSERGALPVLWDAPAFSFRDQEGRPFASRDLRGHVWISDFFFTSCTSICPMMTARMAELQTLVLNPEVRFVSFSVDPEHDTPEVLKRYASMWKADPARWRFLSTDRKGLAETAAAMRTFVSPPEEDGPIQHSGVFILTDGEGRVRGVYDSSEPSALARLITDALTLAGTPPKAAPAVAPAPSAPEPARESARPGRALYISSGCLACHTQTRIAPSLAGRLGTRVRLSDGSTATYDEAYVRESILDPNAKIAAGYAAMMPSYRGRLKGAEIEQLVDYVTSLPPDARTDAAAGASNRTEPAGHIDPVCGMSVEDGPGVIRVRFRGKAYFFCSETCRDRFRKSPERFVRGAGTSTNADPAGRIPP